MGEGESSSVGRRIQPHWKMRKTGQAVPSPVGYVFTVAQIFNLPYRRFVIGRVSDWSYAPWFADVWQSATLLLEISIAV